MEKTLADLKAKGISNLPVYNCDFTVLKTAARVNPTIYYLEQATIRGKWSGKQFSRASGFINSGKKP
jgi:hypothetical protein